MADHDPLCSHADPEHFHSVTINGTPFPCDCPLIARVRADERERVARDEVEVRGQIAAEIVQMDPWVVLGYSNLPDERLTGIVLQNIADRITRVT